MSNCKIQKNKDGKIVQVLDASNKPSTLFKEILNVPTLALNEAIDIYKNVYSDKLKDKVRFQKSAKQNSIEVAIQRNNGNPLNLAPNGQPSILYQSYKDLGYSDVEAERLVAQVYSDSFLDFFGNYLTKSSYEVVTDFRFSSANNYDFIEGFLGKDDDVFIGGELYRVVEETEESGIYKVDNLKGSVKYVDSFKGNNPSFFTGQLDKNGQPILMHHNTDSNFYEYDLNYKGKNNSSGGSVGKGIYLSKSKAGADKYGGSVTKTFFVKANNPYSGVDTFSESSIGLAINLVNQEIDKSNHPDKNYAKEEAKDKIKESLEKGKIPYVSGYLTPSIITEILKNEGFDSIKDGSNDFVVFNPNQIKSATENVGTFSESSNDIRFKIGEEKTAGEIIQELIDRLKQNGLSEYVFLLSTEEIEAKLKELGVSDDVRKQVIAYHGSPHSFDRLLTKGLIQEVEC